MTALKPISTSLITVPKARLLIVEARFYHDLADALLEGAQYAILQAGATCDVITVSGALEIPLVLAFLWDQAKAQGSPYDGAVALGCVIRGETGHYDIVATQSARALMDVALARYMALGNGILTVENQDQAWARAKMTELDKGGEAAKAAMQLIQHQQRIGQES